ncbi:MAG: hypothetical protein AB7V62_14090 [Thermoleophilia bacterium]
MRTRPAPARGDHEPGARDDATARQAAPAVERVLMLQGAAGNRALGRVLAREPAPPSSADAADFNPDAIVNDLRRAIDQSDVEIDGFEGDSHWTRTPIFVRSIHAEAVVTALDNRTTAQLQRIATLYSQLETGGTRTLEEDLFGKGESGYPSVLTRRPAWNARIRGLMKGTRAEQAAPGGPAMDGRVEADAAELGRVLDGDVGEADRERVYALHRRPPADLDRVYAAYQRTFGKSLDDVLNAKMAKPAHRNRVLQLRLGNTAMADAIAIEEKRLRIEELEKVKLDPWRAQSAASERTKLVAGIEGILEMNRQEAIADPANARLTADQAVTARMDAILDLTEKETGQSVGQRLYATLGPVQGIIVAKTISGSLVDSAAYELVRMEAERTTSTAKITPLLRGFRPQAQHDVMARAGNPETPEAERLALIEPKALQAAIDAQAKAYTEAFVTRYEALKPSSGRTWTQIVDSADSYNTDLMNALQRGGGRIDDIDELDIAIRKKDKPGVTAVLKRQPHQEAITALKQAYEQKRGQPLEKALFGIFGDDPEKSRYFGPKYVGALLGGRDAGHAREALAKPSKASLGGQDEVDWIAKHGRAEVDITEAESGAMGSLREIGDDPETQVIMNESARRLEALKAEWDRNDPAGRPRGVILAEMKRVRAALTGDATAYEEENARMVEQLRSAISMAVQVALAVALPGVGGGFLAATALNIGATVAANAIIWGDDYTLDRFTGDVLGGVTGALGGKFGEEIVGAVGRQVAGRAASGTVQAAEGVGVGLGMAKQAGQAAAMADEASFALKAAMEGGNVLGGAALTTAVTGENQFTVQGLGQSVAMNQLGKIRAPKARPAGASDGSPARPAGEAPPPVADAPVPVPDAPARAPAAPEPVGAAPDPRATAAPPAPAEQAPLRPEAGPARTEARGLANAMEQNAAHWPGMTVPQQLDSLARISDGVLAPNGIPPVRVAAGEGLPADHARFDYREWTVRVSPDDLGAVNLGPDQVEARAGLLRHELDHTAQWWDMALLRAGQGRDADGIRQDMGIPIDVARQAEAAFRSGGALPADRAAAAQAFYDSVYGTGSRDRNRTYREMDSYEAQVAMIDAEIAAQRKTGAVDPQLLNMREMAAEQLAIHDAAYRGLPEEVRAYDTGGRQSGEARVMEAERQADLADMAVEEVRRWERDVQDRLADAAIAGVEDPALLAEHHRALERVQILEARAQVLAARRDALIDETRGVAAPAAPDPAVAAAAQAAVAADPSTVTPDEAPAIPRATNKPPPAPPAAPPPTQAATLQEGLAIYRDQIRATPLHECALVYDPADGTYHLIRGGRDSIGLRDVRAQGLVVLRHSHPVVPGTDAAHRGDRFPSAEDAGELALVTPPGQFRMEVVDFQVGGGELGYTEFRIDKRNGQVEVKIDMYIGGELVHSQDFPDLYAYQDFLGREFDAPGKLPEGSVLLDPGGPDDDDY